MQDRIGKTSKVSKMIIYEIQYFGVQARSEAAYGLPT